MSHARIRHVAILLAVSVLQVARPESNAGAVTVDRLRCEYLKDPLGIDVTEPRMSWILSSNERGERQTAYQILVAGTPARLDPENADRWNSGKVTSDQSIHVKYAGRLLKPHDECFWKVRVWDRAGQPSAWSKPAKWSIGPLTTSDWHAKWIGLDGNSAESWLRDTNWIWYPEGSPEKSAPVATRYFRRTFELPAGATVTRAVFLFTGDAECQAFVNGRDVGSRDEYQYVKYVDITNRIAPSRNVIAVSCRNVGDAPNPAAFVARVTIEFEDREPIVIRSDPQWKCVEEELSDWKSPEFDDASWKAAMNIGPVGMSPWGDVRTAEDRQLPARWLRRTFTVRNDVRRASVYVCGLGSSELYLNGSRVGDHVLSPAMTEYPKRVLYVSHDVKSQLRRGENAIGVVLGNGRFYSPRSVVYSKMPNYGFPKLLLHLRIEYADGTVSELVSDEKWRLNADGPILANNEYDGEEYDARKEFDRWTEPGFDDSSWQASKLVDTPGKKIAAQMIEPIRVTQTLKPKGMTEPRPGVYVFDMGQNMVGWCRLRAAGPAGTRIRLRHAETLQPDGMLYLDNLRGARATDVYTLKGRGTEIWEPRFTYHGFRFVEITGFPGKPNLDSIEGRVVHDDVEPAGEFECSNSLINQIYKNVLWGVRGNYRSVPTDCPQRDERQGWLGDRSEESKGETYLFDTAALYSKWLQDMEDSQKDSGSVPDVCPAHWPYYNDNVTWPSSTITIPNMLRRQYGDEAIIRRHYASAKKWVDYMLGFAKGGLIERDSYGDWCVPPEDPALIHSTDPNRITNTTLLATSYFCHDLSLMAQYARALGKTEDADRYTAKAEEMRAALNAKFLSRKTGYYDNGTQTSCVLPLQFELVPAEMRKSVFKRLITNITVDSNGHIGTGLIGAQFLNQVLSDFGRADVAYTIASQNDYPSWGYMVSRDATTIWELWNGDTADPAMNSHNHVMLVGDLVIWLYEYVVGIRPDYAQPGFKHIIMKPHPVGDLTFARADHRSPYGIIKSEWHKDGPSFLWDIAIPANSTATVHVPTADAQSVTESGDPAVRAHRVKVLRPEEGYAVFRIGSGDYHFQSKIGESSGER